MIMFNYKTALRVLCLLAAMWWCLAWVKKPVLVAGSLGAYKGCMTYLGEG